MHDGQDRQARVYLRHRGGHRVPVSVRALPLRDAAGKITGAVETFTDDTTVSRPERPARRAAAVGPGRPAHRAWATGVTSNSSYRPGSSIGIGISGPSGCCSSTSTTSRPSTTATATTSAMTCCAWSPPRMSHTVRAGDPVARYGGEEFVVVLPHADRAAARESAERLRALIAQSRLTVNRRRVAVTVSIGATLVETGRHRGEPAEPGGHAAVHGQEDGKKPGLPRPDPPRAGMTPFACQATWPAHRGRPARGLLHRGGGRSTAASRAVVLWSAVIGAAAQSCPPGRENGSAGVARGWSARLRGGAAARTR